MLRIFCKNFMAGQFLQVKCTLNFLLISKWHVWKWKKKSSQKLVTWLNGLTRTATLTLSPGISLRRINLYYYWTLWYKSQVWIIPKYSDHPKVPNKHRIIVTKSHVRTYFQRGAWRISHTHSIWSITIGIKIPRALCQ